MKIRRHRRSDGDGTRFRLRYDGETRPAKYPGETAATLEALHLVEREAKSRVQVVDIDADDVLYTVRREEKAIVVYAGDHGEAPTKTQRSPQAAV
jgi:hypothetical protein